MLISMKPHENTKPRSEAVSATALGSCDTRALTGDKCTPTIQVHSLDPCCKYNFMNPNALQTLMQVHSSPLGCCKCALMLP